MKTINKIMVAVDFSDYSPVSVQYAVALAADVGAEVLLVNVYNQRDIDMLRKVEAGYPDFSFEKYYEENIQDRQTRLEELADAGKSAMPAVKTACRVVAGVPYEALLKTIETEKPDLLVLGIKGRGNLMDTIVGSCARKLFRHSPIPVLSIRGKVESEA